MDRKDREIEGLEDYEAIVNPHNVVKRLREENERLRKEVKDLEAVVRSYQLGWNEE